MELRNIATIRTKDNTFMEFIIGVLATSEEYHYNITVLDPPKQYVIDIYEADPNPLSLYIREMGVNHIDPEVMRASLTEFEDSVAVPEVKPEVVNKIKADLDENSEITLKQNDSGLQVNEVDIIDRELHKKRFAVCPSCGKEFDSLLDLCEQCDVNSDRTGFVCDNCNGNILIENGGRYYS